MVVLLPADFNPHLLRMISGPGLEVVHEAPHPLKRTFLARPQIKAKMDMLRHDDRLLELYIRRSVTLFRQHLSRNHADVGIFHPITVHPAEDRNPRLKVKRQHHRRPAAVVVAVKSMEMLDLIVVIHLLASSIPYPLVVPPSLRPHPNHRQCQPKLTRPESQAPRKSSSSARVLANVIPQTRMTTAATAQALNCDIMVSIMDYLYLLSLLERISNAYDDNCILSTGSYSFEFRSLIGDIKDVLSKVE